MVFGQGKPQLPKFPGCETKTTPNELVNCFNSYFKSFTNTYFLSYNNLLDYLQYPTMDNVIFFKLNEEGKFVYQPNDKETKVFNLMGNDFITMYNSYLAYQKLEVAPGKNEEGKNVAINFNMPILFNRDIKVLKEETLRFTINLDQQYLVKETTDYSYKIYNQKGELIDVVSGFSSFYTHPILKELVKSTDNLITEQVVDGNKIKLVVYNLFKNQQDKIKISYFENDKLKKEFNSMDKFLNSDYSKYIY